MFTSLYSYKIYKNIKKKAKTYVTVFFNKKYTNGILNFCKKEKIMINICTLLSLIYIN
jgi:hypothetical protein